MVAPVAAPEAAPATAPAKAPKDAAGLKKKWCVDNVAGTFMNADGAPRTPLEQFTTFVNDICPKLEAEVPSKYTALFCFIWDNYLLRVYFCWKLVGVIVSQCFHTGYFMLRELRPLADNAKGANGA